MLLENEKSWRSGKSFLKGQAAMAYYVHRGGTDLKVPRESQRDVGFRYSQGRKEDTGLKTRGMQVKVH